MLVNIFTATSGSRFRIQTSYSRAGEESTNYQMSVHGRDPSFNWYFVSELIGSDDIPHYPYSISRPTTVNGISID